jgi:hypothetical protein
MNGGQKVIVCVAIGAVVVVLGFAARAWWWETPGSGWFNYAPDNGVVFTADPADHGAIVTQALIWIGLVAVWAAACLLVLRTKDDTTGERSSTPAR